MRIITDSAADFTREELHQYNVHCVQTGIIFGTQTYTADDLSIDEFWARLLAGENAKTSQPAPEAFLREFEAAKEAGYATLNYGSFITAVINFLIMATVIFLLVKAINKIISIGKKEEAPAEPTTKVCPFCKSEISIEAVKCPNCTSDIPEEEAAE